MAVPGSDKILHLIVGMSGGSKRRKRKKNKKGQEIRIPSVNRVI